MDRCPNCGAMVRPNAKFCTACGRRLLPVDTASPTQSGPTSGGIAGPEPFATGPGTTSTWPTPADHSASGPASPTPETTAPPAWDDSAAPGTEEASVAGSTHSAPEHFPSARAWQESRWGARPDWRAASQADNRPSWEPEHEADQLVSEESSASAAEHETQPFAVPTASDDDGYTDADRGATAEQDVVIETSVVDLESDSATDFPPEPATDEAATEEESWSASAEETGQESAAAWSTGAEAIQAQDVEAEPEASWVAPGTPAASGEPSWIVTVEADERSDDDWSNDAGTDADVGATWFEELDDELTRAEASAEPSDSTAQAEETRSEAQSAPEVSTATTEDEADETVDSHEPATADDSAPPTGAMVAWTTTQDIASIESVAGDSPVARAQDILSELRSLLPAIAGHHATLTEAFRSSGVDPDELLERIDSLSERTDTAAVQEIATVAAHAEGRERDVREMAALMEQRGAIAELAQTVLEQQLILDDIAAVLRAVKRNA